MSDKNFNEYFKLPILDGLEFLHATKHKINFPFHFHATFNITLVVEQSFSTKFSDKIIQAPTGSLFITNPDEVHATLCENKLGNTFYTFYIAADVLKKLNNNKAVFFNERTIYDLNLFQQFFYVAQNLNTLAFPFEDRMLPLLQQLVLYHSKEILFSNKQTQVFRNFIEEATFEKFSLEQTAQKFGLDKFKFLRLFKSETGLTPNNFIILQRIEKSKKLLESNEDLLAIAIETGFYDATHFCKHFKKVTGVSPNTYRKA